ncbi:hypothetical protein FB451DRAFT_1172886 [Mycena latifolia]|nr:hypothetical protein FB451DRAFT_1172886 [Mycena latifolia]
MRARDQGHRLIVVRTRRRRALGVDHRAHVPCVGQCPLDVNRRADVARSLCIAYRKGTLVAHGSFKKVNAQDDCCKSPTDVYPAVSCRREPEPPSLALEAIGVNRLLPSRILSGHFAQITDCAWVVLKVGFAPAPSALYLTGSKTKRHIAKNTKLLLQLRTRAHYTERIGQISTRLAISKPLAAHPGISGTSTVFPPSNLPQAPAPHVALAEAEKSVRAVFSEALNARSKNPTREAQSDRVLESLSSRIQTAIASLQSANRASGEADSLWKGDHAKRNPEKGSVVDEMRKLEHELKEFTAKLPKDKRPLYYDSGGQLLLHALQEEILKELPSSLYTAMQKLNLDGKTVLIRTCPSCITLHAPTLSHVQHTNRPRKCENGSSEKMVDPNARPLVVDTKSHPRPIRRFLSHSFLDYLARLLSTPEMRGRWTNLRRGAVLEDAGRRGLGG